MDYKKKKKVPKPIDEETRLAMNERCRELSYIRKAKFSPAALAAVKTPEYCNKLRRSNKKIDTYALQTRYSSFKSNLLTKTQQKLIRDRHQARDRLRQYSLRHQAQEENNDAKQKQKVNPKTAAVNKAQPATSTAVENETPKSYYNRKKIYMSIQNPKAAHGCNTLKESEITIMTPSRSNSKVATVVADDTRVCSTSKKVAATVVADDTRVCSTSKVAATVVADDTRVCSTSKVAPIVADDTRVCSTSKVAATVVADDTRVCSTSKVPATVVTEATPDCSTSEVVTIDAEVTECCSTSETTKDDDPDYVPDPLHILSPVYPALTDTNEENNVSFNNSDWEGPMDRDIVFTEETDPLVDVAIKQEPETVDVQEPEIVDLTDKEEPDIRFNCIKDEPEQMDVDPLEIIPEIAAPTVFNSIPAQCSSSSSNVNLMPMNIKSSPKAHILKPKVRSRRTQTNFETPLLPIKKPDDADENLKLKKQLKDVQSKLAFREEQLVLIHNLLKQLKIEHLNPKDIFEILQSNLLLCIQDIDNPHVL